MTDQETTCIVVGGGPAGMFLGLLLARAGVEVTVLEKHGDFLRDFRGDTVHIATMNVLDELGLGEKLAALPQHRLSDGFVHLDQGRAQMASMKLLRGRHKYMTMVPQWDLLNLLAKSAEEERTFTLRRNAEFTDLIEEDGRVAGVRYLDRTTGETKELRAGLTVACDGRGSAVAAAAKKVPRSFEVPIDVWWFRMPRNPEDPEEGVERLSNASSQFLILINRNDHYQCGYLVAKGTDAARRAEGVAEFRRRLVELLPWLGDRVNEIESMDDVKLLDVKLERMRRWYRDGLLLIGDAAHPMSPVGGVGINLAIADAVAAARILSPSLKTEGRAPVSVLRRVQLRRSLPMLLHQTMQIGLHKQLEGVLTPGADDAAAVPTDPPAPYGDDPNYDAPIELLPTPMRMLRRFPALMVVPAWITAIGPLAEHAPWWARRPAEPAAPAAAEVPIERVA